MRAMGFIARLFLQSKPLLIEALGTFLLVLVGTGALTALQLSGEGTTASFMLISILAFSGVFGWLVYLLGDRQRGYFNPAITFFLWLRGTLPLAAMATIVLMQLIGAIAGSILVALLYGPSAVDSGLGAVHVMSNMGPFAGLVAEALGMVFVLATLAKILNENANPLRRGVMLGGALALGQFISLGVSGGALNPARALAPQLVVADARDWWVYWIGPLAGAALVWLMSNWLMSAPTQTQAFSMQHGTKPIDEEPDQDEGQSEPQLSLQQRVRQALSGLRHKRQQPEPAEPETATRQIETKTEAEPEPQYDQYDELPAAPIMPSFADEPALPSNQPTPQSQNHPQMEPQPQAQTQSQNQQFAQAANSSPAKPQLRPEDGRPMDEAAQNPQPRTQPPAVRFVNFEHPSDDGEEE